MTGEDYTKVLGGPYTVTWGDLNLGTKGIIDVQPWIELDPIQPEDYGGEVIAYLLRKKEVEVTVLIHQLQSDFFSLWAGPFAGGQIDDDYQGGYNVSSDANWTKQLILTPRGGVAGRLKFTFPAATPQPQRPIELAAKHFITPVVFKCVRGGSSYLAKWEVTA